MPFSKIYLGEVESLIDLELSYGELNAQFIAAKFSRVIVEGRSTDIDLTISAQSTFSALLIARDNDFHLDHRMEKFERREHEERKGYSIVSGNYGRAKTPASDLTVKVQGGMLEIQLLEATISSTKP